MSITAFRQALCTCFYVGNLPDVAVPIFDRIPKSHTTSEAQWLRAIADADLLFSGRFHHTIAAAFLSTPFIVTQSNTPKVSGLLEMLALDCAVSKSDPDLAKTLIEHAKRYMTDPRQARISLETRERLLSLSLENFADG